MAPFIHKIRSDEKLPQSVDAVVIGGGIVGASAAYFLAKRGLSVALIEKGYVGCEQSSRNWGWCRRQNRDAREMPIANLSLRLWDEMTKDIGLDLGFRRCGLTYVTSDPKQLADWESWRKIGQQFGVNTRMLTGDEATSTVVSASGRKWVGGVHAFEDGKAEPWLAAPQIAEGARKLGATIHQNCAARGLDVTNGQVTGVVTEHGLIRTNAVLCAAGAWASTFMRKYAVSMPQASVRQTSMRTGPAPDLGDAVYTSDFAMTRRIDGTYTIAISGKATLEITPQGIRYARPFMPMFIKRLKAVEIGIGRSFFEGPEALGSWSLDKPTPFERMRVLDPAPNAKTIALIMKRVTAMFPTIASAGIASSWAGYIDSTPDAVPVISPVGSIDGVYLAAGCSGHGFGVGPGIGHLAAELVAGDQPTVDPTPFRLSRFSDSSKINVGDF
ncbi:FAD-binding oxidoreductase [Rhizobium skierniewicense]|uniref:NAD(P)/FAD-dependent oxidoreductase n=1 Tax=Rhizobium skierniewicense TaxID=984260 RepID=UPI001FABDB8F|nr:FAD-binding oxidoreductase [Rhizobium skierniewicense]MCI9866921.1 FAD-binding oxidoreductase [Rhizobium skierniewicense]